MSKPKWTMVAAAMAALLLAPSGSAQTREEKKTGALTPEQTMTLERPSDLNFSPYGTQLAFTVTEAPKGSNYRRNIWMLDVKTHAMRRFTSATKSDGTPRWSLDGKTLAFLSNREERQQIYLISAERGEAVRLTSGKLGIQTLEWSPDGKQIAFLATDAKTEEEERKEKDKDDAEVIDKDEKHARLWILDVATRAVRVLTPANWNVRDAHWLPNGKGFIAAATDHPESDQETYRILTVDAADGKMKEITAPRGPFRAVRVSPDGATVSYIAARVDGPSPHDLFAAPMAGGAARNLTGASIDRPIESYTWRADGRIVALVATGFTSAIYEINREGQARRMAGFEQTTSDMAVSRDGLFATVSETSAVPAEVWLWEGRGTAQRITNFNEKLRAAGLRLMEVVRYKSFDGTQIEAGLLTPAGYDGKTKLPFVVLPHGGPTGRYADAFSAWGQLLAARGFAVLLPNIRGSTGYGSKFVESNRADWGGGDFKDMMAGVDYAIARGIADPERLGIGGWSYGGYMSEWAITQTNRFKAAVCGAGLADLASEFGTENGSSYDEWFFGLPYEKLDGFIKSSPVTHIKNARTPTLILQGAADTTDPIGQSQQLYRPLKRYGVETEFVVYPREGHGIREENHRLDVLRRMVGWFEKYLK